MRIITLNLNGIRAAARKGFFTWLAKQSADVICLQETKALMNSEHADLFCIDDYHCYYADADKKGYSGVGIYCKNKPDKIINKIGFQEADSEGRYIQADFGNLSVVSVYLPSGSSGAERQKIKFAFMDHYLEILRQQVRSRRDYIICGDWNIVHKEIDIKNFKANQKHSGCLPEERTWLDGVLTKVGFVDAFRVVDQEAEQYTWWSNRGRAWEKNVGWRIDYQMISPRLKNKVKSAEIYKKERFSDHAPLIMDYSC